MKSKSLLAVAIAGAFTCATAFAGGADHRAEIDTPSSVSESAPWLTGEAHLAGWTHPVDWLASGTDTLPPDDAVATGSTLGVDPPSMASAADDSAPPYYVVNVTEYWLIGDQPAEAVGSISSSAGGSLGFDSTTGSGGDGSVSVRDTGGAGSSDYHPMSYVGSASAPVSEIVVYTPTAEAIVDAVGEETVLMSEHYLVPAPLSSFDASNFLVIAIGPSAQDLELLDSLKEDFFVLTPSYGGN